MCAIKANLYIDQGCDFSYPINLIDNNQNPLNVTPYTANAQMKKFYTDANSYPFTTNLVNGSITIAMNAANTANIAMGRYVYDVILYNSTSNTTVRIVEGIVTINPGVAEPNINLDDEYETD